MNFFLEKIFKKIKVYFFYFLKHETRKYFFVLIRRKIYIIFNKKNTLDNHLVVDWCKKKTINENNFYRKVGIVKPSNFFVDKKNYYISARREEKKLNFKMGGMAHLNLIYNLTKYLKPTKILETGVAFGWSTLVLILSKPTRSKLISIDLSYPSKLSEKYVAMALPSNLKSKFKLLRGIDYNHLNRMYFNKIFFDFIHYDSDKSYLGRKKNYELIWNILKKKGCFISDDISDNPAFYEFINSKKVRYHILRLGSKYVGVVFK